MQKGANPEELGLGLRFSAAGLQPEPRLSLPSIGGRQGLLLALGQVPVVIASVCLGRAIPHPGDPPHAFTLLLYVSFTLLLAGTLEPFQAGLLRDRYVGMLTAVGVGCYYLVLVTANPFFHPPSTVGALLTQMVWLCPLLLAGVEFARRGCWFVPAAISVLLFDCVALLTFNLHWMDGADFLCKIRR